MDADKPAPPCNSPTCEESARHHSSQPFAETLRRRLPPAESDVAVSLHRAFRVPESGIGLVTLVDETARDLAFLKTILPQFALPEWSDRISAIASPLQILLGTEPARDLTALRNLPRGPLRDYLAAPTDGTPVVQIRFLRALRAMITLTILSARGELPSDLAMEFARWLKGKVPQGLEPASLDQVALAKIAADERLSASALKLVDHIASALHNELTDPFPVATPKKHWFATEVRPANDVNDEKRDEPQTPEPKAELDIIEARLAAQASATRRMLSGVFTFQQLHPFELEAAFPRILALDADRYSDEVFAAESALHLGILPRDYHRILLQGRSGSGYALSGDNTARKLDIDRIIKTATDGSMSSNRTLAIPFPLEFAERLNARSAAHPEAITYDQLLDTPIAALKSSTRATLLSISLSAHHVTLTRLAGTLGRYVLHLGRDETFGAVIGLDFTLGSTANFNYFSARGDRLEATLTETYRRIGYSGRLANQSTRDVLSPRLPDSSQVESLLRTLAAESRTLIVGLPRNCPVERLIDTHNRVARNIYTMFKFLSGTRPLAAETVTRSQLYLEEAYVGVTEKRISPYHELRLVGLSAYATTWLQTYVEWLRLLAYRLSGTKPALATLIHSATTSECQDDWHPLFFSLSDTLDSIAMGSSELADTLAKFDIVANGGRHWVEDVARSADIDSATIMGQAGRGNAGQELFSRWSGATPAIALRAVPQAVDRRLEQLDLPRPPSIASRQFQVSGIPIGKTLYLPKLLTTETAWMEQALPGGFGAPEACPFSRGTLAMAARFAGFIRRWRSTAPPQGWPGVALSLVFEDGVAHEAELLGALVQIAEGSIYVGPDETFVDSTSIPLGIRRTALSVVTRQLARRIPAEDPIPRSLSDLDGMLKDAGIPRIGKALASAAAYASLNLPAAISAWSQGAIFARTSRPETIARETFGLIEPPVFDLRRRNRCATAPMSVAEALNRAKEKQKNGASDQEALKTLRDALEALRTDGSGSIHAAIEIGYLSDLAATQENLYTLLRYESGARKFVSLAAAAIEESGPDGVDWKQVISHALDGRQDESAPDTYAINFVLRWLGIDIQVHLRSGAPPSARKYADIVTPREAMSAAVLLRRQSLAPADDHHLAWVALRLCTQHPIRWDSLAHLRLCDLALEQPNPHFVIVAGAGARLKSGNAERVIQLSDGELARDLLEIVRIRRARFPGDDKVPVFGDLDDPRSIEAMSRVHGLVTDALWRASGSPMICVHDLRHRAITDRANKVLAPDAHQEFDALYLRQGLVECAVEAGQCWPEVSVEDYGHDLDRLRTAHYRAKIADLPPPSEAFVAAVTGTPASTIRKRRSRQAGYLPDLSEGLEHKNFRPGSKIVKLASLVVSGQPHVTVTEDDRNHCTLTPRAIYVGLRLLGDPPETARAVSALASDKVKQAERALAAAPLRLGYIQRGRADINRQTFLDTVIETRLAVAMHHTRPPCSVIARIERAQEQVGDQLAFAGVQDALDLAPWIRVWAANGIATEFLLRPSGRSVVDQHHLNQARRCGVANARTIPPRHFYKGTLAILRLFTQAGSTNPPSRIRASPQLAFLVSACALSFHFYSEGGSNVQET